MTPILNTLLPVFLVIGLGYLLAKRGFFGQVFLNELNSLLFRICLPALIIHSLATAGEVPSGTGGLIVVFFAATVVIIALSLVCYRLLKLPLTSMGTLVQASFRANLAYVGLPLLVFALRGLDEEHASVLVAQFIFLFVPTMIFYNSAAVILLVRSQNTGSVHKQIPTMIATITKNPLIIASLIGILLFLLPFDLPRVALESLSFIGRIAAPAALLMVGGGMAFVPLHGRIRSSFVASALKVFAMPLITYQFAILAGIEGHALLVLMIASASPTAVASYVMVKEMKGDEALASGTIVISTLLCIPSMAIVIGFF